MRGIHRVGALQRKERSPRMLRRFWNDESGQDLVETILIILIMALVVWAVFPNIGAAIRRAGDRVVEVINRVIGYNP
jgi:Flp pilus assembly pilin Flp